MLGIVKYNFCNRSVRVFAMMSIQFVQSGINNDDQILLLKELIPFKVSIPYLMNAYDILVHELDEKVALMINNDNDDATSHSIEQFRFVYNNLLIVCSLLLHLHSVNTVPFLSDTQKFTIDQTARRSYLLQKCIDYHLIHNKNQDSSLSEENNNNIDPFNQEYLIHVEIKKIIASGNNNNNITSNLLEWSYRSSIHDIIEDDDERISQSMLQMIDKEELAYEENLLLDMANTPIPNNNNCTTTPTEIAESILVIMKHTTNDKKNTIRKYFHKRFQDEWEEIIS